ncbi:MAG TPA: acetoacetate decarboxylase family protein, partial [Thermodesulfobacteriota bacterium]|nr:acetoacetate decarboxylase family protein [Thermodesulfobacteriota bacterium]
MRRSAKLYAAALLLAAFAFSLAGGFYSTKKADAGELPAPQLVTDAWMFMAAYKADPETLKALLPPGLEPNPAGHIVINMYTVPTATQTSGFGAYTLTYLTVELKDQDSYVLGSDTTIPGRYFVHYYNSSPTMREYTKKIGIPAEEGMTTTTVKDGKLTAVLTVEGKPLIEATADVGKELGSFGGGHLNYFGLIASEKDGKTVSQVVKYPIPWVGGTVEIKDPKIKFTV